MDIYRTFMKSEKFNNFFKGAKLYFDKRNKEKTAFSKYTIVSACYNVSDYLDDFFRSIIKQTIGFEDNIYLIMVDDGSTDNTATIIKKWVDKYPDNIQYIYKENSGQADARNLGLNFVKTPWVAFTDPDDFLNDQYFANIDDYLSKCKDYEDVSLISTHIVFYYEETKSFKDNHPLNFKFKTESSILPASKLDRNIQLSAASAVFNFDMIKNYHISFPNIKPNFEDAYFIGELLIKANKAYVVHLKNSKYYYRKRTVANSSIDGAWKNIGMFSEVFIKGYLPLLNQVYKTSPSNLVIQNLVLYALVWHILHLVNKSHTVLFLSDEDKNIYLTYLDRCFSKIDVNTIFNFSACGIWHYHKLGICNCFKHEMPNILPLIYIEKFDSFKDEIRIRYFTDKEYLEEFYIGEQEIIPSHAKWVQDDFLNRTFILQRIIWLPLHKIRNGTFKFFINGTQSRIYCNGKQTKEIYVDEIRDLFTDSVNKEKNGPWLFMDRINQADDNAEHLYRYIKNNYRKQEIYFLLDKSSRDWNRLCKDDFHLVEFGSAKHKELSEKCSKIISSHIDQFVTNYWKDNSLDKKQIIFLQHGIIKDDLSNWLNSKKRIDLFVTTTVKEWHSIVDDFNKYRFTDKEVKLLGIARHDELLNNSDMHKRKLIVVMPTWRASLASNSFGNLKLSNDFTKSEYFLQWKKFLCSKELEIVVHKYEYEVLFVPHPNMSTTLSLWKFPKYIQIAQTDGSIQEIFKNCSVMITDYSSVAFEIGYLNKPVIYFQFDEETFWTQQVYQKGYFDYRVDGFGPVCTDYNELITELEKLLKIGCANVPNLKEKVDSTYIFRDGKNCERTYQAILDLDRPNNFIVREDIAIDFITKAVADNKFKLAKNRAKILFDSNKSNKQIKDLFELFVVNDLICECKLPEAAELLKDLVNIPKQFSNLRNNITSKLYIYTNRLDSAKELLESYDLSNSEKSMLVWVYEKLGIVTTVKVTGNDNASVLINLIYKYYLNKNFKFITSLFEDIAPHSSISLFAINKTIVNKLFDELKKINDPFLYAMISRSAIKNKNWIIDGKTRSCLEKIVGRNVLWRSLAAYRANIDGRENAFNDVYQNLNIAYSDYIPYMSVDEFDMYLDAIRNKFSPKIFNKKKEKITYEIQTISDSLDKDIYLNHLKDYCNS